MSPFLLTSSTPWPLAFRLRGQDPFVDLGPGWFAMGPGVSLGSSCLSFPPFSLLLVLFPASMLVLFFCRRRSCCGDALSFFSFLAALPCVLCSFSCGGCAWGVLFVYCHLLKRVCSSPTGASQHALASPPSGPLSVLLLLACLSVGIWWYWVMLCTRTLSYRNTCGDYIMHARTGDLRSDPGLAAGCFLAQKLPAPDITPLFCSQLQWQKHKPIRVLAADAVRNDRNDRKR